MTDSIDTGLPLSYIYLLNLIKGVDMVDMNTKLSDEIETALAKLEDGEIVECEIQYKDNGEPETVSIAMHGDDGESDDDIFFYCDSVNDFRALLKDDNGEDFVVIGFDNGKDGGRWHR